MGSGVGEQLRLFGCDHDRVAYYDFGVCQQTGYHDAEYVCEICGELLDDVPLQDEQPLPEEEPDEARKPTGQILIPYSEEEKAG
jgi:hypothetical protein